MLSVHEPTWSKEMRMHVCCGSRHSYHRSSCTEKNNRAPGRASDPDYVQIQALKQAGLSSGEVANELKLPLDQVNEMWIS